MQMTDVTVIQLAAIFAAYIIMCLVLPSIAFHRRLKGYTYPERIMAYVLIGNFFMMNAVFILELLHIAYRPVIIIFTAVVFFVVSMSAREKNAALVVSDAVDTLRRQITGTIGQKQVTGSVLAGLKNQLRFAFAWVYNVPLRRFPDFVAFIAVFSFVLQIYGTLDTLSYGYGASDMIVHNYWINALSDNKLFVGGIYPMGFHAVIFYLHIVFGLETFTLLRLFNIVQLIFVALMLYMFLSATVKGAFFPALGVLVYLGVDVWNWGAISRFSAPLPQEYGMVFILPSLYFLMRFLNTTLGHEKLIINVDGMSLVVDDEDLVYSDGFIGDTKKHSKPITVDKVIKKKKRVIKIDHPAKRARLGRGGTVVSDYLERLKRMDSVRMLLLFAAAFSMTISVHFYDTIIAGLGCVGVAVAYFPRILRKEYFFPILRSGILSLAMALYPMVICFALGTPLQGSMGWAMGVMKGSSSSETDKDVMNSKYADDVLSGKRIVWRDGLIIAVDGKPVNGATYEDIAWINEIEDVSGTNEIGDVSGISDEVVEQEHHEPPLTERLQQKFWELYNDMKGTLSEAVINNGKYRFNLDLVIYLVILLAFVMSMVIRLRNPSYGRMLLSLTLASCLVMLIFVLRALGLPQLMDVNRTRVFYIYILSAVLVMLLDSVPYFAIGDIAKGRLVYVSGILCVSLIVTALYEGGTFRKALGGSKSSGTNGAVTTLSSIVQSVPDQKWTIVSANDEMRMGEDHGYHYELIEFLRKQADYDEYKRLYIPTEYVFFFVEKVPVDYYKTYNGSGQPISVPGAAKALPLGKGLGVYQGENRWILMSKLFYWAKTFKKYYPQDISVYYEDKTFICYKVHQNERSLYNFALDYEYNGTIIEEEDEDNNGMGVTTGSAVSSAATGNEVSKDTKKDVGGEVTKASEEDAKSKVSKDTKEDAKSKVSKDTEKNAESKVSKDTKKDAKEEDKDTKR